MKAMRRARSIPLPHRPAIGQRYAAQDLLEIERRHRPEQAVIRRIRRAGNVTQPARRAAIGDAGIEHGDVGEADAQPAEGRQEGSAPSPPAGKARRAPAFSSVVVKASGPTRSSTITAGTLSDMRSASVADTAPWKLPSKSLGA